jgi:DNA adenine methylase
MGGKSLLAGKIVPRIPKHRCYCEVFAGAAWVLFAKEESKVEIINDININLVTLYRVVKHHLDEFVRYLKWILVARDEFERFKKENPETLTDIQRAVRFFFLLKAGFGSRMVSPSFGIAPSGKPRLNLLRIEEELSAIHLRLSGVYIENRPYEDVIKRVDRSTTFFYLDPPYYDCEDYYGKGIFGKEDFVRLQTLLSNLKGKFILSINDVPEIRELFKGYPTEVVKTSYSVAKDSNKKVSELLIANF